MTSNRGSPHRRSPNLYFNHVYIERNLFCCVRLVAESEHISIKAAVHNLLNIGLHQYVVTQLKLEKARLANTPPPKSSVLDLKTLEGFLKSMKKKEPTEQDANGFS